MQSAYFNGFSIDKTKGLDSLREESVASTLRYIEKYKIKDDSILINYTEKKQSKTSLDQTILFKLKIACLLFNSYLTDNKNPKYILSSMVKKMKEDI